MKNNKINQKFYQLKLPLNVDYKIPANYEISKTRKYKNDIGKLENM